MFPLDETLSTPPLSESMSKRARQAAKIVGHPERYKVCEGCDSIVAVKVTTCPNCYGYRFNEDRQDIIAQAQLLGSREQTSVVAEDLL